MQLKSTKIATYGTRFDLSTTDEKIFDAICHQISSMTRKMLHAYNNGNSLYSLKNSFIRKYNIPARYFNGARIMLDGLIKSSLELSKQHLKDAKKKQRAVQTKLARIDKRIKKGKAKQYDGSNRVQLKRKLGRIKNKIEKLSKCIKDKYVSICFGGKKLFNKQFNLEEMFHLSL